MDVKRSISFNYDEGRNTHKKEKLLKYLDGRGSEVDVNNNSFVFVPKPSQNNSGLLIVFGDGSIRDETVEDILSVDMAYSPTYVSCSNKEDYVVVEEALAKRGDNSHLPSMPLWKWIGSVPIRYGKNHNNS